MNAIKIINWRPYAKKTLLGFLEIELPSGLRVRDMTLHQKEDRKWISYPAKAYIADDGTTKYKNIIFFEDKETHGQFQRQVLAAIDAYIGGTTANEALPF